MPPVARARAALCGLLAIAGLAACADEALAPRPARAYRLFDIGGRPVPALVEASGADSTFVTYDEVDLLPFGVAVQISIRQRVRAGVRQREDYRSDTLRYEQTGDHIVLVPICPPNALCAPGPAGTVTEDWLLLTAQVTGSPPPATWRYVRLIPVD
jgi:hypothetical protein